VVVVVVVVGTIIMVQTILAGATVFTVSNNKNHKH